MLSERERPKTRVGALPDVLDQRERASSTLPVVEDWMRAYGLAPTVTGDVTPARMRLVVEMMSLPPLAATPNVVRMAEALVSSNSSRAADVIEVVAKASAPVA